MVPAGWSRPSKELSLPCSRYLDRFTERRALARGQFLWKMGDDAKFFGVVVEGAIEIARVSAGGEEVILSVFGPGGAIGVSAVLGRIAYPATARAVAPNTVVRVIHIEAAQRQATPDARAELQSWLDSLLLEHEEILRQRLMIQSSGRLAGRLCRLLEHLSGYYGRCVRGGGELPFGLEKKQIALLLAARPETVIRLCSKLQKQGLVRFEPSKISVPNWARLESATLGATALQ